MKTKKSQTEVEKKSGFMTGGKKKGRKGGARERLDFGNSDESDCERGKSDRGSLESRKEKKVLEGSTSVVRSPREGEYVLVLFAGKGEKHFVGKIIKEKDTDDDLEVSYLRQSRCYSGMFELPLEPDIHGVNIADVKATLPRLLNLQDSRRKSKLISFDFDFSNVKLG